MPGGTAATATGTQYSAPGGNLQGPGRWRVGVVVRLSLDALFGRLAVVATTRFARDFASGSVRLLTRRRGESWRGGRPHRRVLSAPSPRHSVADVAVAGSWIPRVPRSCGSGWLSEVVRSPRPSLDAACGVQPTGNARHAAACVIGVLEACPASADDLAVSLLDLLELVEHAERENPGMRGSEFPPGGRPSPGRRLVEMLLRGVYSLERRVERPPAARRPDRRSASRPATHARAKALSGSRRTTAGAALPTVGRTPVRGSFRDRRAVLGVAG